MNRAILRDKIDSELAFINMSQTQRKNFTEANNRHKRTRYRPKRPLVVLVALICCFLLSVPILGATVPAYNNLLSRISPELAGFLMPVDGKSTMGASVTDNGISITVISAVMDDYHMLVMLEIKDEEGRLHSDVLPVYDGSNMDASLSEVIADYDNETGTLTVLWYELTATAHTGGDAEIYITKLSESRENMFNEEYITGSWTLAFTPEYLETTHYDQLLDFDGHALYDIAVSPISLTMKTDSYLYIENDNDEKPQMIPIEVEITMIDGSVYNFTSTEYNTDCQIGFYYSAGNGNIDIAFAVLIYPRDIASVTINGETLDI
jgi:hypothetical protein